jgi:acyl-CoA thioester hydrolase
MNSMNDEASTKVRDLLAGFPVIVIQKVIWGEMDAYRHVNNVVYFRYFENARLEYIARLGWFALEKETGVGPILASTQARFRRPLTYPDTISIGARLLDMGEDRFTMEHRIVSHAQEAVVTEGQGLVVTYHYTQEKKVPVPEELKRRISALEATAKSNSP